MKVRLFLAALALVPRLAVAQGLDAKALRLFDPPADAWPTYNGDYSGRRYSPLKQINASNLGSLALAWMYRIAGIGPQRGVGNPVIKSTPLMVNGVLYFTIPDHVFAVNARTGEASGNTTGRITAGIWWAIAAWACTASGCISLGPTAGSFRWMPKPARSAGTRKWPTRSCNISRPWRRWW